MLKNKLNRLFTTWNSGKICNPYNLTAHVLAIFEDCAKKIPPKKLGRQRKYE